MKKLLFLLLCWPIFLCAQNTHLPGYVINDTFPRIGSWTYAPAIFPSAKTLNFFGHSWVFGTGASSNATRWTSQVCAITGSTEGNYGVAGRTLMTDGTGTNYQGVLSAIQTMSTIPNNTTSTAGLIVELGLNDLPNVGTYTLSHFSLAWDTLLRHIIDTAHYNRRQVAVMGMEWIPDAALTYYGTISSSTAPTRARLLQFDSVIKAVCLRWGIPCIQNYYELRYNMNDSTNYVQTGSLHLNDVGHLFLANNAVQQLSFPSGSPWVQSGSNVITKTIPSNVVMGNVGGGGVSTSTPHSLTINNEYGTVEGPAQMKDIIYDDGTTNNRFGFGVFSGKFMIHAGGASTTMDFWINGTQYASMSTSAFTLSGATQNKFQFRNTTSSGVTTPDQMNIGGTFFNSSVFDSSKTKYTWYQSGSSSFGGIGINTLGSYFITPHGFPYYLMYDNTQALVVSKTIKLGNYGLGTNTGTAAFALNVDASGNIIEGTVGSGGFANPMTTAGDIITGGSAGTPTRLGIGSNGTFPVVNSGALAYTSALPSGTTATTQSVGTNNTTVATTNYADRAVGNIFTSTADASSITNTGSTLTVVGSGVGSSTIAANTLQVGSIVTIDGTIIVDNYASGSISVQSQFGGSGGTSINFTPPGSATSQVLHVTFRYIITSTGTTGTMQEMGSLVTSASWATITGTPGSSLLVNTTTTNATGVFFQFGTASSSNTAHGMAGWRVTVN